MGDLFVRAYYVLSVFSGERGNVEYWNWYDGRDCGRSFGQGPHLLGLAWLLEGKLLCFCCAHFFWFFYIEFCV